MDAQLAKQHKPEEVDFKYTTRDAIIFALGVGCTVNEDLRYVYEGADGFMTLPSYITAPGVLAVLDKLVNWPGIQFDLTRCVHGDQYLELFKPIPAEGSIRSEMRVVDLLDKGSGALIMSEITTYDASSGAKLAMQQIGIFQMGSGNFGGTRASPDEKKGAEIPKRPADKILADTTSPNQAALYRMASGDLNPLHIDAEVAKKTGFNEPILHGLCSMGFAARHVLKAFANNDAAQFKAIKARFSSPVLPGQTLETHMWDEGDRVVFETKVKETGKVAISNGYVVLHGMTGRPRA